MHLSSKPSLLAPPRPREKLFPRGSENPAEALLHGLWGVARRAGVAWSISQDSHDALLGRREPSTALGEQLDPETLSEIMGAYFESMKVVVERHEGTVAKFIGDTVMAVFGIPELHEDDALRAVRAAADM